MKQWFTEYWPLVAFTANTLLVWAVWALSKTFAKKEAVNAIEVRVTKVENTIAELPNLHDFHELDKNLVDVSGKLDALKPQLDSVQKVTELLMENELRGKQK